MLYRTVDDMRELIDGTNFQDQFNMEQSYSKLFLNFSPSSMYYLRVRFIQKSFEKGSAVIFQKL